MAAAPSRWTPATLDAMAGRIAGVAGSASSTRGSLGGAASAAAGLPGTRGRRLRAAPGTARREGFPSSPTTRTRWAGTPRGAAQAYVATDNGQM